VVFDRDFYANTGWNLNNIPTTKGSLLQFLRTPINGINVPWLYVGMLFASFCWHNEDNYFYSISYNHFGATKQWYSVPGDKADDFERVGGVKANQIFTTLS
jgi:histone demethylase JARID1